MERRGAGEREGKCNGIYRRDTMRLTYIYIYITDKRVCETRRVIGWIDRSSDIKKK